MIRTLHEECSSITCHLLRITGARRDMIVENSGVPDELGDVKISTFGGEPEGEILGRSPDAFCHFQLEDGGGYRLRRDSSLSRLEQDVGATAMELSRMRVFGTSGPMARACLDQPGVSLGDFRFPSASEMGRFFFEIRRKFPDQDGRYLHPVQDLTIEHHALGFLLDGHERRERVCAARWFDHRRRIRMSSDPKAGEKLFTDQVRAWTFHATSIEDLIAENGERTRRRFATSSDLSNCSMSETLDIVSLAVASSMWAIGLADKAGA